MMPIPSMLDTAFQHHRAGRLEEAGRLYHAVLRVEPDHADALHLLGLILRQSGASGASDAGDAAADRAAELMERAIALRPAFAAAHFNLGNLRRDQGRLDDAARDYRHALILSPGDHRIWDALGHTLFNQDRNGAAEAVFRSMVALWPELPAPYNNLAGSLRRQGRLEEAAALYRRAVTIEPRYASAWHMLGNTLRDQGRIEEALDAYHRALAAQPDFPAADSNRLLCLQYQEGVTAERLAEHHAQWEQAHGVSRRAAWRPHPNPPDPRLRLRVGLVSADLRRHPIGFFVARLLDHRDRRDLEVFAYSDHPRPDDLTRRLRAACDGWLDSQPVTDDALAERIRADGVDILIDLAGHTGGNRLPTFAARPAPVQITWAGYVGTTGLAAMDGLIADRHHVPPGEEPLYAERVIRLPDGYIVYDPPDYAPAVGELPALRNGYVTFGSFNNLPKLNPGVVAVWSEILRRLPTARLVLKTKPLGDPATRARAQGLFAEHGLGPERVALLGPSAHPQLLGLYNTLDLALDPFPYSGGLTTCEALWMGVPVITCGGRSFAGRHSLSHLRTVGLSGTVAASPGDYVERAVALAQDWPRLAAVRAGLRAGMAASPLCDGPRFARHFAAALRQAWSVWCNGDSAPFLPSRGNP